MIDFEIFVDADLCEVGSVIHTQAMSSTHSRPTVLRRIVGAELRRLRAETGESQSEVEKAVKLNRYALSRYEKGQSSMQAVVADAVFRHYGVTGTRLDNLIELANQSRKRGWLQDIDVAVPSWFEDFVILERSASEIYELALSAIPGVLQEESYARAMLQGGALGKDVDQAVATRMDRAAHLAVSETKFWAIIRESALDCAVGGRTVMAAQLEHLIAQAESPNVTIQVIPNEYGAHMSMTTAFSLMRFRQWSPRYGIVYSEKLGGAIYDDDAAEVEVHDNVYRHLIKVALPEDQSVRLIRQTIKDKYS